MTRTYNRRVLSFRAETIEDIVREVHAKQREAYKIQISVGYVLRDIVDGSLEYYFASSNTSIFKKAMPVIGDDTLSTVISAVGESDVEEKCLKKRPNSRYKFFAPVNVLIYTYSMGGPIRGTTEVEKYCKTNSNVISYLDKKGKYCFFLCLAGYFTLQSTGTLNRRVSRHAKQLFKKYAKLTGTSSEGFQGIDLANLEKCEEIFKVGVHVIGMELEKPGVKPRVYIIRSAMHYTQSKMYVILEERHFMLIRDIGKLSGMFECGSCYQLSNRLQNSRRHESSCTGSRIIQYKGGTYYPRESIVKRLEKLGVEISSDDFQDTSVIVFDFEVELKQHETFHRNTDNLHFTQEHIPLSVAIASNVQGYLEPVFFFEPGNCTLLIEKFVKYLLSVSHAAQSTLDRKLGYVHQQLEEMQTEAELVSNTMLTKQLQNMSTALENFINRTPVVGFNSSRYDLRAVKHVFFLVLHRLDNISMCIKKDGAYLSVASDNLRFLDIAKFLGPGDGGLVAYLKSYGKGLVASKMVFPYALLSEPEKLVQIDKFPKYSRFKNRLVGGNLFEVGEMGNDAERRGNGLKNYRAIKSRFESGEWANMLEYLKDYNCHDV